MKRLSVTTLITILIVTVVVSVAIYSVSKLLNQGYTPFLYSLDFAETPSDNAPKITTFKYGKLYYFVIHCYDEDMDIQYACQSLFSRDSGEHATVPKVFLTQQTEKTTIYYGTFTAGAIGDWTVSIYFEDRKGNRSNIITQNFTIIP